MVLVTSQSHVNRSSFLSRYRRNVALGANATSFPKTLLENVGYCKVEPWVAYALQSRVAAPDSRQLTFG